MIAQPAETGARERRLAEAVVGLYEASVGRVPPARLLEMFGTVSEAHAVLASPEAPAKAWVEIGDWPGTIGLHVRICQEHRSFAMSGGNMDREMVEDYAEQVAEMLGLEVRR